MPSIVPHLLLRANSGASNVSTMLRAAGYMVSKIGDDATVARMAGAAHVDGVVIELPALASIAAVRAIEAQYGRDVVTLVITPAADTVRRALPSARVLKPAEVDDDLISTIDLALVAHQMRQTG